MINNKSRDAGYQLPENDLDSWGWTLVGHEQISEALEVFKLNVNLFPRSGNACDSYGWALEETGRTAEAIKIFKRALELNPGDNYAIGHLKHLGQLK